MLRAPIGHAMILSTGPLWTGTNARDLMDRITFQTADGMVFDTDFGLPGATFAERVEVAREALEHLLWQFASAMGEPDLPDQA